nr:variable large family protein [Borreliella burgdorferi]
MAKNGKFAVQNAANGAEDSVKSAIEKAIEEISKKLKAIADAAKAAAAVDVGEDKIGNVVNNNGGAADKDSVKGIAKGMKGIVDASDGGKELKGAGAGGGGGANGDAGHLFAGDGNGASAAQAGKAAAAVNAVSGEQILKAIVDAAGGEQEGQGAGAATNPISAAIGAAGEGGNFGANGGMNRNDKIAAAIVLRGMAKDGKFAVQNGDAGADGASVKSAIEKAIEEISKKLKAIADAAKAAAAVDVGGEDKIGNVVNNGDAAGTADAGSVKGIAKGMKKIVDAADGGKELKGGDGGGGAANAGAGHLFAGDGNGASAEQAGKAAAAVNAVSGEQILKAIVDAAKGEQQQGQGAGAATNPISAAIGAAGAAADFAGGMNGNDKIAAAIVLRGMAKDGKFAVQDANGAEGVKSAVDKAIEEISKKLKAIADAAKAAAAVDVGGGEDKIGNVVDANNAAAAADAGSVNGIAKGMKGIVDAADGGKELKGGAGDAGAAANASAEHLFAGNGADAEQAGKAAAAVNAVSGEQILKAIVDAAGGEQQQVGAAANEATNPISAAIGAAEAGANFGAAMNGNDKIAAAIVLRGMAKNGKFAVQDANGAQDSVKSAVEKAIEEISKKLKAIADAAKAAAAVDVGGDDKIGNVVNNGDAAGTADAGSVKGIAKGMKKIVDASDGGKELKGGDGGGGDANAGAGHLFAGNAGNANAEQAGKAAAAVNAVSGEQILKAIVDAAGNAQQQGQAAGAATNPISAAIGTAEAAADFANAGMNRNDKIAAAIVLRGMAKNGKFAVQDGAAINAVSGE